MCGITRTIDLIHDTDGIKTMSRGISGGKQVVKFANTSNRGPIKRDDDFIVIQSVGKIYVMTV